ncbi:hypothetical protein ACET3X_000982 [Alternaria dauci]|uniref:Uncharacterized protein n=1 Tax=Alternaria dauci TaxID=48095 RepID=A0ABR3UVX1_9PLEO
MLIFDFEKKRENPPDFVPKQVDAGDLQAEGVEIERFKISRAGQDTLSFKRKIGDARREDPTRPVLSRALTGEHCVFVCDTIMEDPTVDTIIYEDDIDGSTIARFVACISPASRSILPTHDVVEILDVGHPGLLATEIEWSMDKLEDLYMFAHVMRAFDVCDMVIDRVYEELHHPQQNLRRSTTGVTAAFKLPDISPAFLNFLWRHDKKGFEFFTDILVMAAEDTLELLKTSGLGSWHSKSSAR